MSKYGMSGCPNCGQKTVRTEDWACRWCGYPLPAGFYEKIAKTYRQLQEEKLHRPLVEEEAEVSPPPGYDSLPPIEEVVEPEPVAELETEPVEEPGHQPSLEPESGLEPVQESQPEPIPADEEVSAEELILAYASNAIEADAKYTNEVLNVTGVVARVEIRKAFDIHYIFLTSADEKLMRSIRCMFDKKYEPELLKLIKGETVTVQGKYNGSLIDFRMQNCVIVRQPSADEPLT